MIVLIDDQMTNLMKGTINGISNDEEYNVFVDKI
jgi:hypothetical protein